MQSIDTRIDEECERLYPAKRSGVVRVTLESGTALERRVLEPKGEAANPMSDADLEQKFRANCEPIVGEARCDELLQCIWHFDASGNISGFLRLLAGA